MSHPDPLENPDIQRVRLYLYFIPIFGVFPALWAISQPGVDRSQRTAGRLAVALALGWLVGYVSLGVGVQASEVGTVPLLLINSLLTSGYFVANLWLMVQVWQQKPPTLPIISSLIGHRSSSNPDRPSIH